MSPVPRLSIIIPYTGNAKLLEETLLSVLEHRPRRCEILVVLGRPYDDPYKLTDEVRFIEAPRRSGPVRCVNLGIRQSSSSVVHVLACGATVRPTWADAAIAHFADSRVGAVAPLVVEADCATRVVAAGVVYRPGGSLRALAAGKSSQTVSENRQAGLAAHHAAVFYRRSALELIGPLRVELGRRLAGVDAALSLELAGMETVLEPSCRVGVLSAADAPAGAFSEALHAERLYWRWAPYGGWLRSLASHGVVVAAECLRNGASLSLVSGLAARTLGCCRVGTHRAHYRRLQRTPERCETLILPLGRPETKKRMAA